VKEEEEPRFLPLLPSSSFKLCHVFQVPTTKRRKQPPKGIFVVSDLKKLN